MRRVRWGLVLALALVTTGLWAGTATAATHAPCVYHNATAPHIVLIDDGVSTLEGSGAIGGCPAVTTTAAEGVTLTVTLQHLEDGVWVDKATKGPATKGWNRYWRYARQLGLTVQATCLNGDWRTEVRGGDGWQPTVWWSPVVTLAPGDSGVCGSYGGGD